MQHLKSIYRISQKNILYYDVGENCVMCILTKLHNFNYSEIDVWKHCLQNTSKPYPIVLYIATTQPQLVKIQIHAYFVKFNEMTE